jgi:diacylglycerol kinase (ATP)
MACCSPDVSTPILTEPLLLFVNPASGGGLGLELMSILTDVANLYMVQLPAEHDTWPIKYASIVHEPTLRACVAGGDGFVNWVVALLCRFYTGHFRPPLAVIPFGTGNDMSRMLQWGCGMSSRSLMEIGHLISRMMSTDHIEDVDLWSVAIREVGSDVPTERRMVNYISFGVNADITHSYQAIREACQPLFCCQCMSTAMFFPAGCANVFSKRDINEYMTIDLASAGREPHRVKAERGQKTIVFMSTPTIYGGARLWRGPEPMAINDGKLEVLLEGGVMKLVCAQAGINFSKSYAQREAAQLHISEPCFYQIDGEASATRAPATFQITRAGSYPFLFDQ